MNAITITTAVTMPAMALVPSLDSVASSVAAAAVALLVALVEELLVDVEVLVAEELVATTEDVRIELTIEGPLDDAAVSTELLTNTEDPAAVSSDDEVVPNDGTEEVKLSKIVVESLSEGSGT